MAEQDPKIQGGNENLTKLHQQLVKDNYELPDYNTFASDLSDPVKSKAFYDGLVTDKYELPDYDTFVSDLGLKKKDASEYGLPTSKAFSDVLSGASVPSTNTIPKDEATTPTEINTPLEVPKTASIETPKKEVEKPSVYDEGYSALMDVSIKGVHPDGEPVTAENYITAAPQAFNQRMGEAIRNVGELANLPQNTMDFYINKFGGKNGDAIVKYLRHALGNLPIIGLLSKENVDKLATTVEKAGNPKAIPQDIGGSVLSTLGSVAFDISTVRAMPTSKINALAKYGMERVPMFPTYLAAMQGGTAAREGGDLKKTAKATAEGAAAGLTYEGMGITAGRVGEFVKQLGANNITTATARAFANSALFEGDSRLKGGEKWTGAITGLVMGAPDIAKSYRGDVHQSMAKRAYVSYLTTTDNAIRNISKMNLNPEELRAKSDEIWDAYEATDSQGIKNDLLAEKTVIDNMINVNAMTQVIIENPTAFLNEINNDQRLTPKDKEKWVGKIRNTVLNADPRIEEAMPFRDKIVELEQGLKEVEAIYPDPMIRAEKTSAIEEQIKEQKQLMSKTLSRPLQAQPKYEMAGSPIEKDEVLNLVKEAKNVEDLEGLSVQNDPAIEKALQDKFGETAPKEEVKAQEEVKTEPVVEQPVVKEEPAKAEAVQEPIIQEAAKAVGKTIKERKKRSAPFKPGSRTFTAVEKTPNDFTEAVLQYFVGGGRIKTQDLIDQTGYPRNSKDLNALFGLHSTEGTRLDVFNEALENSFGRGQGEEGMDMINEVMDIVQKYPSRGKTLEELEHRQKSEEFIQITDEEIAFEEGKMLAEERAQKIAKSHDVEESLKNGLITKSEYDEITEYLSKQSEQDRLAEEAFSADLIGKGENIQEEGTGEIPTQSETKPVRTEDPVKQKQIEAIDKDTDLQIVELEKASLTNKKAKDKAIAEAQDRQGLFGDTKETGEAKIFSQEEQGFGLTAERLKSIEQPFKEKEAELNKEIARLNKERESKIGEILKQKTLDFNEPIPNEKTEADKQPDITTGTEAGDIVPRGTEASPKPVEAKGKEEPIAATEVKVEGFTPKEVMNKAYRDFKAKKMGTKEIQEYFTQVDRLFNPNKTTVAEYRYNGVVVKEGDKYIFHALADMDTKTWREAGKFDVTEQFAEAKVDSRKLSLDKEEIKVGDYVNYGVDPRARGFNESQLTPYLQKVTGFREIGGLLYPTFDVPKGSKKKNFGYSSQEYTIIKDAEQLLSKKPELTENKPTEKKVELTKEEELKAKEISATKEGIKYGDKTYTERDQVQDDFDKFPSLQEYNKILDKVGKFEDGLRDGAKKASVSMDKKMGNSTKEAEDRMLEELGKKKGNDGKVAIRFLPPDPIPLLNTVLYKQLVKVRDALNNRIASVLQSGMKSQMDLLRWSSKALTNFWGGLGRTQADIHGKGGKPGKLAFTGTIKTYAKYEGKEIRQNLLDIIHSDMESSRRVLDVTDPDPNFAIEKLNVGDLSLAEKNLYFKARDWNTWTHETNYAIGMLDTETYLKNKDATGYSTYVARMYDKYENETLLDPAIQEFVNRGNSSITTKMLTDMYKAKGESTPWKKEHAIRDITYLTAKRVVETIQNVAVNDYQSLIIQEHPDFVLPVKKGEKAPDGYTQLGSSYSWGQFRNKAVINHVVEDFTGFYYSNAVANDIYNAFKKVDRTNVNQFYKKLRTVYNPMVQLGNATGDIFFASINGINPITFLRKSFEAKLLPKKNPEAYKALLKTGLIGDVAFTGEMKPLDAIKTKEGGILSKADEMATKAYVGTDNIAKISAYLVFREQGMSHEASVRRSYDAFQNYSTVGKTWDFTSKIPIIGPTFAKFQADLQRILVNAVTTTPLTLIGTLMLIKMAGILASTLSGESDEERKAREGRKGVAKIPFVNIPLSFKVGKSEVNVARYLSPLYNYNYADAGTQLSEISKFLPIQFSKVNRPILGETSNIPAFADATWGWIGAVAFDRDYRGISIQNPKASLYHNAPISNEERLLNAMTYIARSQVPFFKGAQDMYDGIRGNLDYYGRKRTWQQTILNNIIKIQEFDKPEIKSYVERNLDYLTSRFASLGQRMGDSNAEFIKTLKDAEKQGLSEAKLNQIYQDADKKRTTGIKISEEKMPVIMKEIEKLTTTYAKWYPDDPFLQENYKNIEAGKNSIFNVLNEVDLQKQYPKEYSLLKNNGLLNKPEIPKFFRGTALTDAEKKSYSNIYWSEYIRELDARVGLTQEEITELKDSIVRKEKADTPSGVKEVTRLEDIASKAASRARVLADRNFRTKK